MLDLDLVEHSGDVRNPAFVYLDLQFSDALTGSAAPWCRSLETASQCLGDFGFDFPGVLPVGINVF